MIVWRLGWFWCVRSVLIISRNRRSVNAPARLGVWERRKPAGLDAQSSLNLLQTSPLPVGDKPRICRHKSLVLN